VAPKIVEEINSFTDYKFFPISDVEEITKDLSSCKELCTLVGIDEREFKILESKIESFQWKWEARDLLTRIKADGEIINELEDTTEVKQMLMKCPKDLRSVKAREWIYLWERVTESVLEEEAIENKIKEWCGKDLNYLSTDKKDYEL